MLLEKPAGVQHENGSGTGVKCGVVSRFGGLQGPWWWQERSIRRIVWR